MIRGWGSRHRWLLPWLWACRPSLLHRPWELFSLQSSWWAESRIQDPEGSHQDQSWWQTVWLYFVLVFRFASCFIWFQGRSVFPSWSSQPQYSLSWQDPSFRKCCWYQRLCFCSTLQESKLEVIMAEVLGHCLLLLHFRWSTWPPQVDPWCTCLGWAHPWHFQRFLFLLQPFWVGHYISIILHSACSALSIVEVSFS